MSNNVSQFGQNQWLVDEMYERFSQEPSSVDTSWHEFFDANPGAASPPGGGSSTSTSPTATPPGSGAGPQGPPPAPRRAWRWRHRPTTSWLPWRTRQTALFVSEKTLLPVLMPFAPAATLLDRFPDQLAHVLARHQVDAGTVARECVDTTDYQVATIASRSVVGSMNEFDFLADAYRQDDPELDLLDLSIRLSAVPCGPLYRRQVSPDRELQALLKDT